MERGWWRGAARTRRGPVMHMHAGGAPAGCEVASAGMNVFNVTPEFSRARHAQGTWLRGRDERSNYGMQSRGVTDEVTTACRARIMRRGMEETARFSHCEGLWLRARASSVRRRVDAPSVASAVPPSPIPSRQSKGPERRSRALKVNSPVAQKPTLPSQTAPAQQPWVQSSVQGPGLALEHHVARRKRNQRVEARARERRRSAPLWGIKPGRTSCDPDKEQREE